MTLYKFFRAVLIGTVLFMGSKLASSSIVMTKPPVVLKYTYVAEIRGSEEGKRFVKYSLDYFNRLGNNQIVTYTHPGTIYARSIVINFIDTEDAAKKLAGIAWPFLFDCDITVYNDFRPIILRQTIIHEYLHCMGYRHSDDKEDIMYFEQAGWPQQNEEKYAKDLLERLK